jgi:hypothetical protein
MMMSTEHLHSAGRGLENGSLDYPGSQASHPMQQEMDYEGGSQVLTVDMQRRLLAKTKTDKINALLKKSKTVKHLL